MKIGIGLRIDEAIAPHLLNLPINFVVPYCNRGVTRIPQLRLSLPPHIEIKGETLLSPHHHNNRYLWDYYAHLRGKTKLETERYILRDILQKIEKRSPYINQWELFNELVKDNGNFRKCEKCEFWDSEFYPKVVREVRSLFPEHRLLYSDYNFKSVEKYQSIQKLVNELNLDGVCIQLHLAIASLRWIDFLSRSTFANIVKYFHDLNKWVVVSEVGIRMNTPSTFAMLGTRVLRSEALIKDLLQYRGMRMIPEELRRSLAIHLWQWLIERCLSIGVDEFYCFQSDRDFVHDEPSLVDRDFNWKLLNQ